MPKSIVLENLNYLHWVLAYAGALLQILKSLAKSRVIATFVFSNWLKQNILAILINAITLPVILIVITETSLQDLMPINYLTAVLAGYQTQSVFDGLVSIGQKKYISATANDGTPPNNKDVG